MESISTVVVSNRLYRAESLASVISEKSGCRALASTPGELEKLTGCDVVLIDLDLENGEHWELIHAIAAVSKARIVLLGLVESEENVLRAVEARASGYVAASAGLEELLSTVVSMRRGEFTYPQRFTYMLFEHLTSLARSDRFAPRLPFELSTRERKILELISQNLTNKEIAARLFISEHTAKNHVHRILKKLGARSRHHLSASARARWTFRAGFKYQTHAFRHLIANQKAKSI
jgi:DNA-binding NarL/FixJ family response regulator